ncbi:MAG: hypothetical protein DRN92_04500 [Thermoproteota archaeon]|nr:MAG: hypothetical protein DRN92_04500 [Candidatus Korarchaeota archaeon]
MQTSFGDNGKPIGQVVEVKIGEGRKLPVEGIDQALEINLPCLKTLLTGAYVISKLPLYHRDHSLNLPPLAIYPIKTSLQDKLPASYPLRINDVPSTTNRRDYVQLGYSFCIKPTVCKAKPGSSSFLLQPLPAGLPLKEVQEHTVRAWSPSMTSGKDHLGFCSHCICPLPPGTIPPPCPGKVIGTFSVLSETCRVKADELFLDAKELEKAVQHPIYKGLCEP